MKFIKTLVSAVTVAIVIVTSSVPVKAAGDTNTTQTTSPQTQSQPIDTTPPNSQDTTQPEATSDDPNQAPAAPASSTPNAPAASNSNLNSQTPTSNTQFQSSALNFSNSCGTQLIGKTGGNTTGVADWSIGVSWNINNPCTPPAKQENLSCQQNRVNAMQMILASLRQDPKNPKPMLTPAELRAYLDTICVLN
jgi:hypothetical protein